MAARLLLGLRPARERLLAARCFFSSHHAPLSSHFQPLALDAKWQQRWAEQPRESGDLAASLRGANSSEAGEKPNKYVLAMFPYPSGELHMGHVRVYTITDVIARWHRLQGHRVLHPMGWDSFGLPAENAAMQRNIHPEAWTKMNVARMKGQLQSLGLSLDWERELMTSDPSYYRWTQWLFLQLHRAGLVEQRQAFVNWDPVDQTVLANEQVDSQGRSWRSGAIVERRALKQWFVKTREYADELLQGLDTLEKWPEAIKLMQRNWIGQSKGHSVDFKLAADVAGADGSIDPVTVFTTRLETLQGVVYVALAPGSETFQRLRHLVPKEREAEIEAYCAKLSHFKVRSAEEVENPSGVDTGLAVVHPLTGQRLPVFLADYVIEGAGTGAVMGVPAHDERDHRFARGQGLAPVPVLEHPEDPEASPFAADPRLVLRNSGPELDGKPVPEARAVLQRQLEERGAGGPFTSYRLQNWLVSRQRFWGCPVPVVHCRAECGAVPVPEEQLPVELPQVENVFKNGAPDNVLASSAPEVVAWRETVCPCCGGPADRDTDTLDTFVDSSWYFLRYLNPFDDQKVVDIEASKNTMPVDVYVGGIEHATSHLLYSRFIHRFLHKQFGISPQPEPFAELLSQGMVQAATYRHPVTGKCVPPARLRSTPAAPGSGAAERWYDAEDPEQHELQLSFEKMSKSKFNGVQPEDVLQVYGADTTRLFTVFAAPPAAPLQWDPRAITGVSRWLQRVWNLVYTHVSQSLEARPAAAAAASPAEPSLNERRLASELAKALVKVAESLERRELNTVVSELMIFTNAAAELAKAEPGLWHGWVMHDALRQFVVVLAPMAPHVTEELWNALEFVGRHAAEGQGGLTGWKPAALHPSRPGGVHEQVWPTPDPSQILVESVPVVLQINGTLKGQVDADPEVLESDELLMQAIEASPVYAELVKGPLEAGKVSLGRVVCRRNPKRNMGLVNFVLKPL